MEKIPNHKGYHELSPAQKTNLNAVRQDNSRHMLSTDQLFCAVISTEERTRYNPLDGTTQTQDLGQLRAVGCEES